MKLAAGAFAQAGAGLAGEVFAKLDAAGGVVEKRFEPAAQRKELPGAQQFFVGAVDQGHGDGLGGYGQIGGNAAPLDAVEAASERPGLFAAAPFGDAAGRNFARGEHFAKAPAPALVGMQNGMVEHGIRAELGKLPKFEKRLGAEELLGDVRFSSRRAEADFEPVQGGQKRSGVKVALVDLAAPEVPERGAVAQLGDAGRFGAELSVEPAHGAFGSGNFKKGSRFFEQAEALGQFAASGAGQSQKQGLESFALRSRSVESVEKLACGVGAEGGLCRSGEPLAFARLAGCGGAGFFHGLAFALGAGSPGPFP